MKLRVLLVALCCSLCADAVGAAPRLIFKKEFPGSQPPFVLVQIEKSGQATYKEAVDEEPLQFRLSEEEANEMFSLAGKLEHFRTPLESGLKVANTGKKTFRYEGEDGAPTEVVFNYSLREEAKVLQSHFERIVETERAWIDLDRTARFDKLGVNQALGRVESLWMNKKLAAPAQFLPLLSRISRQQAYMHVARERAARLKDAFEALPKAASVAASPGGNSQ